MAQLTHLAYRAGNGILFDLDVRCKLICTCMVSVAVAKAGALSLFMLSLFLFILLSTSLLIPTSPSSRSRFSFFFQFLSLLKESRLFFLLLFFILMIRSVVTPGESILSFQTGIDGIGFEITKEGVWDGIFVCWRFFCIMIMGILFTATTRPSALKHAVEWLLAPIPFIPEKRAGVMVSLFIRFLPLILTKSNEVSDAQKARCAHLQKNPVKRVIRLGFPILSKVIKSADTLSIAMIARCYSEERTHAPLALSGLEKYFYSLSFVLSLFLVFFP